MPDTIQSHDIEVRDVEYLRHGDKPLLARVYQPKGTGPFPLVVDIHGGAWCRKDRTSDAATDEALARSGAVAVALDFRMPPDAQYPGSLEDINYAVRWCKAHAKEFGARPDKVALLGVSSGGHQAALTAMKPNEYASIPLEEAPELDASVSCVVLCWPVVDPLKRYQYAHELKAKGDKHGPQWVEAHDAFWGGGEAEMAKANPKLMLDRGEKVKTPPVLYIQGLADIAHPVVSREGFIDGYRKAGGTVELHTFEGMGEAFITTNPTAPESVRALEKIVEFVHRRLGSH